MTTKSAWLLAAGVSTMVAVSIGATVMRMIPGATIVDVGALIVTGFLAGLFTGFHLVQRRRGERGAEDG